MSPAKTVISKALHLKPAERVIVIEALSPFWKSPGFNPGMNGDFVIAGGSPGL